MRSPYGTWPSPFSAAGVEESSPRIDGARFVGDEMWWGESVPAEKGRMTVRTSSGATLLPEPWNVRSRVHEYGGGAWTADADGILYFVEFSDQRVYRLAPGQTPEPLTTPGPNYGGLRVQQGRLFAVRERLDITPHERGIVEISLDGGTEVVHACSSDFYAHPALSPDGQHLAWVRWDETRMPWQQASLQVKALPDGAVETIPSRTALQPEWVSDDTLLFSDDPTDRWNLHRVTLGTPPELLSAQDADTGYGLWVLGNRWYQPLADGRVVLTLTNGSDELAILGTDGTVTRVDTTVRAHVSVEDVSGTRVLLTESVSGVWLLDADTGILSPVRALPAHDPAWVTPPTAMSFAGAHGDVHCFFHAPRNPDHTAPDTERAPVIVRVHGGPTAHVSGGASASTAYWTSRGIGVLDVNYGGSTGYGRAYRERLDGQWGIVDVDDVTAAAQGLVDAGLADPQRITITGGSAGGWTVYGALVAGATFTAGISRYGVADLRAFAAETHDFEKYYLDGLVAPLPEGEQLYIDRSPLTHVDRITAPLLLLQGSDDRVVPPGQSHAIRDALAARGIRHEYIEYAGEGHGFRQTDNRIAALEAELRFLGETFGFTPSV